MHLDSYIKFRDEFLGSFFSNVLADVSGRWTFRLIGWSIVAPEQNPAAWRRTRETYHGTIELNVECSSPAGGRGHRLLDVGHIVLPDDRGLFVIDGVRRTPIAQFRKAPGLTLQTSERTPGTRLYEAKLCVGDGTQTNCRDVEWTLGSLAADSGQVWFARVQAGDAPSVAIVNWLRARGMLARVRELLEGDAFWLQILDEPEADLPYPDPEDQSSASRPIHLSTETRRRFKERVFRLLGSNIDMSDAPELSAADVCAVLRVLSKVATDSAAQSCDHPGDLRNQRVWLVGDHLAELFASTHAANVARARSNPHTFINRLNQQDKVFEALEDYLASVVRIAVRRYVSSSLCQPLDDTNPLSEASHQRLVTWLGPGGLSSKRGSTELRAIHESHRGRVCLLETPESDAIGLRLHFARDCGIVDGQLKAGAASLGLASSLVPFIAHNELARAGMGAKNMKQALPLLHPERPLVSTGFELEVEELYGRSKRAASAAVVTSVEPEAVRLDIGVVDFEAIVPSRHGACVGSRPAVRGGAQVSTGEVVVDGPASVDGSLALGANVLVAYVPWRGWNIEDGIVISDRLVYDDVLTSQHAWQREIKVFGDCERRQRPGVPGIGADGVISVGASVRQGDVLVTKWNLLKGDWEDSSLALPISGTVHSVEIDRHNLHVRDSGQVREVVRIVVFDTRRVQVGDKLTGRHGNKGVVTKILSRDEMPSLPDGTPVDMLLNPHGLVSRMNLGQLLETHWGWVAHVLGCRFEAAPFARVKVSGANDEKTLEEARRAISSTDSDEEALRQLLALAQTRQPIMSGPQFDKAVLSDGGRGERLVDPVVIGYQYVMKLNHLAVDKIQVRSDQGAVAPITEQPARGRRVDGGQRFGEMEVWALLAHQALELVRETVTLRSDDLLNVASLQAVLGGEKPFRPYLSESVRALAIVLRGAGLKLEAKVKGEWVDSWLYFGLNAAPANISDLRLTVAGDEDIRAWAKPFNPTEGQFLQQLSAAVPTAVRPSADLSQSPATSIVKREVVVCPVHGPSVERAGQAKKRSKCPIAHCGRPLLVVSTKSRQNVPGGLFDPGRFGSDHGPSPVGRNAMGVIELACPLINPAFVGAGLKGAVKQTAKHLLSGTHLLVRSRGGAGEPEIREWDNAIAMVASGSHEPVEVAEFMGAIEPEFRRAVIRVLPVVPPAFRSIGTTADRRSVSSDLHRLYNAVARENRRVRRYLKEGNSPVAVLAAKRDLQRALNALMLGGSRTAGGRPLASIADLLNGKFGLVRHALLGKRVNYSGRAVLTANPDLSLDQCAIPEVFNLSFKRALGGLPEDHRELFEPVVLLNRAPSLHRYNVLAFRPLASQHQSVGINPLVCGMFNADFDGDTIGVHQPLLRSSRAEAFSRLLPTKHLRSIGNGQLLLHFTQDVVSGAYMASMNPESRDGRKLAAILPGWDRTSLMNKKALVRTFLADVRAGRIDAAIVACDLMRFACDVLTRRGASFGIWDFPSRQDGGRLEQWLITEASRGNCLAVIVHSGARGDLSTLSQVAGERGTIASAPAQLGPVRSNFRQGLSEADFFVSAFGARKTLADKKLVTATAGALARTLVELCFDTTISEEDCGTQQGLSLSEYSTLVAAPSFADRFVGRTIAARYLLADGTCFEAGTALREDDAVRLAGDATATTRAVLVRSPLSCLSSSGICRRCYGFSPGTDDYPEIGLAIGIIAGQSIGERGTQLTMRTFHSGGVSGEDITAGLPRVNRLIGGHVDMKQVTHSSGPCEEWDVADRVNSDLDGFNVDLDAQGKPVSISMSLSELVRTRGEDFVVNRMLWEFTRIYGDGVDQRHFEVVLRELRGTWSAKRAMESKPGFLVRASSGSAVDVLTEAAWSGQIAQEVRGLKARLMLGAVGPQDVVVAERSHG